MRNSDMPAMPARVLDPEIARTLKDNRGDLGMSLQKVKEMASLAPGLTKREHFAAMAMQGMQSNPSYDETSLEDMACVAVDAADSLLAELERTS